MLLDVPRFSLGVLSSCSIPSARNVPVLMMAMRSHRIPCLLSATKGITDSAQRREGLGSLGLFFPKATEIATWIGFGSLMKVISMDRQVL